MAEQEQQLAIVPGSLEEGEERVYVKKLDGGLGSIPLSRISTFQNNRDGEVLTQQGFDHFKMVTEAGDANIQAGAEAVARGATLGLSDVALEKTGLATAEGLKARQEANPIISTLGEVGGTVAGVLATGGAGAAGVAGRVATAPLQAAIRTGIGMEARVAAALAGRVPASLARVAAKGAGLAVEGGAMGAFKSVAENELDPEFTAEAALSNIGLGTLLGGSVGVLGTAGRSLAGKAVPAAMRGTVAAGRAAVGKAAPVLSKISGVDAAELRALASAERAAKDAVGTATRVMKPHTAAVSKAVLGLESASNKIAREGLDVVVRDISKKVTKKAAQEVADASIGISRAARVAAEESGDKAALRAAKIYDNTVANMRPGNVAGRFNAALKLRNAMHRSPTMKGVVTHIDDHLGDKRLYDLAAEDFVSHRSVVESFKEAQLTFDSAMRDPKNIEKILQGVRPGTPGELDVLRNLTTNLDELLKTRNGKYAQLFREGGKASKALRQALANAEKAVAAPNATAEAATGILQGRAQEAAKLASRFLPSTGVGGVLKGAIDGTSGVGVAAGLATGNPAVGMLTSAAVKPKEFLNTLTKLQEHASSIEQGHKRILQQWMKGKDVGGKVTKTAAKLSPSLYKMQKSKDSDERREHFVSYRKSLVGQASNIEQTAGNLHGTLAGVRGEAPTVADAMQVSTLNKLSYLVDSLPPIQTSGNPFGNLEDSEQYSDAAVARFTRVASIVENPTNILPRIADGTVTRDEVLALRETAPAYHRFLVQTIAEHVPDSKLSYAQKLTLGTVFEAPTTPGLEHKDTYQDFSRNSQAGGQQPQGMNTRTPTPAAQDQLTALDSVTQR